MDGKLAQLANAIHAASISPCVPTTMKRALLADDDPVNLAFLSEALTLLGWHVEAFEAGAPAADAAINQHFDALLLDLNMPGIDGIETLRRIRNLDSHASADTPALALTADHRPELHRRLRQSGFDGVATKPLTVQQLSDALAELNVSGAASISHTMQDAAMASRADTPIWDDASALPSLAGNHATLAALRKLMLADLPQQRDRILSDPTAQPAREELHRLRAACGFCGAIRLAHAVIALEQAAARPDAALTRFTEAVEKTLATPPP